MAHFFVFGTVLATTLSVPAATDRLAPLQRAAWPAVRQRPRPDAEIAFGGEVSWCPILLRPPHHSITSSAVASSVAAR